MLSFNLYEELLKWKEEHGSNRSSSYGVPYKCIEWANTKHLILILVEHLKNLGAPKAYFYSANVKKQIGEACTGPQGAVSKKAYNTGMTKSLEALKIALIKVYGTDYEISKKGGPAPEAVEDNTIEDKAKAELDKYAETKIDPPKTARTSENTVHTQPEPPPEPIKKFDPSKSDVPEADDIVDPEMADLLGYNDER